MATRMQQRRGTAAQWISTNGGAGPVLNAGEMGWESDTNKFKIGDGVNNWTSLDYFSDVNSTVNPAFGSSITFEGATANDFETTLAITDPTADRTITFPDSTGTVALTSDITVTASSTNTLSNKSISLTTNTITGTKAEFNSAMSDADFATIAGTETLTNKTLTSPVLGGTTTTASGNLAVQPATYILEVKGGASTEGAIQLNCSTNAHGQILKAQPHANEATNTLLLPGGTTIGNSNAVLVSDIGTQTLTNKTLTSPVVSGLTLSDASIVIEGATGNEFETTLTVTDPTADRTITFPDATGTVQLRVADVSDEEIAHLNGVTSAIQTQIDNKASLSGATFTGAVSGTSLTLSGDLTVNGTTTTINSTEITVDDKNITLGSVATPTDAGADGGGITLKGATDKTLNWVDATDAWTSSEHFNIASGKSYYVNGTALKDVSETLTNKTLTSPVISGLTISDGSIVIEGSAADEYETTLAFTNPTADRVITFPDASFTVASTADISAATGGSVSETGTQTLTNKTLTSAFATTAFTLSGTAELRLADTDSSHYVGFKAPGTVTSNKIWTLPAADGASGQVLTTDGSGTFSFSTPAAGAAFSEMMLIGA